MTQLPDQRPTRRSRPPALVPAIGAFLLALCSAAPHQIPVLPLPWEPALVRVLEFSELLAKLLFVAVLLFVLGKWAFRKQLDFHLLVVALYLAAGLLLGPLLP